MYYSEHSETIKILYCAYKYSYICSLFRLPSLATEKPLVDRSTNEVEPSLPLCPVVFLLPLRTGEPFEDATRALNVRDPNKVDGMAYRVLSCSEKFVGRDLEWHLYRKSS
jgi:hypothetical protein